MNQGQFYLLFYIFLSNFTFSNYLLLNFFFIKFSSLKTKLILFPIIAFIICVIMNTPLCNFMKKEIRNEIQAKIFTEKFKNSELIKFSEFELNNAKWINETEIILNKENFDLVKIENENGLKVYYFLNDHRETKVNNYQRVVASFKFLIRFNEPTFQKISLNKINSKLVFIYPDLYQNKTQFHIPTPFSNFKILKKRITQIHFKIEIPPEIYC